MRRQKGGKGCSEQCLFSLEAWTEVLQPGLVHGPVSGEGSGAQEGPGLDGGGLSQTVWVSLSREDRSLCVCKR